MHENAKFQQPYVALSSYRFILWAIALAMDILAIIDLISAIKSERDLLEQVMFVLIAIALSAGPILMRGSLIAQNQTIRAEGNLRHFAFNGKAA